jgi:GH24 family phage-related lysozyme (muramidase)
MRLFGGFLNNPEIMSRLPPFMRGPNSPFMGIFNRLISGGQLTAGDFAGLTRNMPPEVAEKLRALGIDPSIVPIEANPIDPATGKFKYGTYSHDNDVPRPGTAPGSTDRGGRTSGSDIPATEETPGETGLTDLPGGPSVAPQSSGAVEPDRVPAQPAAGNPTAAPGATDGSTANPATPGFAPGDPRPSATFTPDYGPPDFDIGRAGDPVQGERFPGMNDPIQGWPGADLGPGAGPMTPEGVPLGPSQRNPGAVAPITRERARNAPGITPRLSEFVKKQEDFRANAYGDFHQFSIGYGTKARYAGERINREEAEKRMNEELTAVQGRLSRILPDNTPQNVRDALTSFSYNVGTGWTRRSALAQAVKSGDWRLTAMLMQRYNHAGGRILPALVKRRRQEAQMLLSPDESVAAR